MADGFLTRWVFTTFVCGRAEALVARAGVRRTVVRVELGRV